MFAENKRKHNIVILVWGLILCGVTQSVLLGMWTAVITSFQLKWEFLIPMLITGLLSYAIGWTVCSWQRHSTGLEIDQADEAECTAWINLLNRRIGKIRAKEVQEADPRVVDMRKVK